MVATLGTITTVNGVGAASGTPDGRDHRGLEDKIQRKEGVWADLTSDYPVNPSVETFSGQTFLGDVDGVACGEQPQPSPARPGALVRSTHHRLPPNDLSALTPHRVPGPRGRHGLLLATRTGCAQTSASHALRVPMRAVTCRASVPAVTRSSPARRTIKGPMAPRRQ